MVFKILFLKLYRFCDLLFCNANSLGRCYELILSIVMMMDHSDNAAKIFLNRNAYAEQIYINIFCLTA